MITMGCRLNNMFLVMLAVIVMASGNDVLKFQPQLSKLGNIKEEQQSSETIGPRFRYDYPFQDPTLPWETRLENLVSLLTLDETAIQTQATQATPGVPRLGIKPYVWFTECIRGQLRTNTTAFPHSIGLAASFSKDLIHEMAEAISYEVRAHWNGNRKQGIYENFIGLSCFSPVINTLRHPLWGRNQETYGECPYLSGSLVQSFVRGLQGDHPRYVRVNAGCKHFDVHGGPENIPVSRFSFDAKVSEMDWRMTFLPQFKMCVEAGTYSMMCSYNSINGVPACSNTKLLTSIARQEWGFRGYVVSDDGAIYNIISQHKYLNTSVDTAAACIKAGCNLELGSSVFLSQQQALQQGKLTEEDIKDNIRPLFYTRLRLGEFDPESMVPYNQINMSVVQSPEHRELAIKAATKSFVLLKNDQDFLPLKNKYKKVSIIGPMANNTEQIFGNYASDILPQFTTTPYQGLKTISGNVVLAPGCNDTKCQVYDPLSVIEAARDSDLVIVCLGTGQALESEGNDRSDLDLPGRQLDILMDATLAAEGAPVVLLLFNAGPLDITWAKMNPRVVAIMACFFPAQSTGKALYRTLLGLGADSRPAGRLPATWPADISQVPPITDYTMKGRTYRYYNGIPLYPFGYGLSYTRFNYTSLEISSSKITQGSELKVVIKVKNIGQYESDEVIQLYMSRETRIPGTPWIQLVGFSREQVPTGKEIAISFIISAGQMSVWSEQKSAFYIPAGKVELYAGGQQPYQLTKAPSNILHSEFEIVE